MKIKSITIRGFRCFDETGEFIDFDNLTCFVGPNASGKTAAMIALARIFGETRTHRQVIPTDFHLTPGEDLKAKKSRTLLIECRLAFPEFEGGDIRTSTAIPETFNQMVIDEQGGTPYCRIRLDATWTNDETSDGDIEQSISWITTSSDDPEIIEKGNRHRVQPGDRGKIRVVYVPATRDPGQLIRVTTETSYGRLLRALNWNGNDESIKRKLSELKEQLASFPGVQVMNKEVKTAWGGLYDGRIASNVAFEALDEDPAALIQLLVPTFRPGEDGQILVASDLSDGLRSLFSLSLSLGLFRVEELLREATAPTGFRDDVSSDFPTMTLFAVEEPENHLSPHYLGRVISELSKIARYDRAQIVVSSHSPCILGRVVPENVRYFLGHETTTSAQVKTIPLPPKNDEETHKYVREAVRGFPELYFSRLVVLGEGPSELIVLRRLFEATGIPLDSHFISVVPLGGKHVNHFWRLLHGLQIPFITLLDLDREKEDAGWGRIQYVRNQLIERFGRESEFLRFTDGDKTWTLGDKMYDELYKNDVTKTREMDQWISFFTNHFAIFFSHPLDLDLAMLEAFPDEYKKIEPPSLGPQIPPAGTPEYNAYIQKRVEQVLSANGITYTPAQKDLFPWYKYLFLDGSKPASHIRAMSLIENANLISNAPASLKQLVARTLSMLKPQTSGEQSGDTHSA